MSLFSYLAYSIQVSKLGQVQVSIFQYSPEKGSLSPEASRMCMESRPTAYLWDKLRKCE